eukprot:10047786-Prorocentrum_lima.AAC.1
MLLRRLPGGRPCPLKLGGWLFAPSNHPPIRTCSTSRIAPSKWKIDRKIWEPNHAREDQTQGGCRHGRRDDGGNLRG